MTATISDKDQYTELFLGALSRYGHDPRSLQQPGVSPLALARRQGIPEGHLTGAFQIIGFPIAEGAEPYNHESIPAHLQILVGVYDSQSTYASYDPFDDEIIALTSGLPAYAPRAVAVTLDLTPSRAHLAPTQRDMRTVLDALLHLGFGDLTPEELLQVNYQEVLLDTGRITPTELAKAYALLTNSPYIDTQSNPPHANVRNIISAHLITSFKIVPHSRNGNVLTVLQSDPTDPYPIQSLEDELQAQGIEIVGAVATAQAIDQLILSLYHRSDQEERLQREAQTRRQNNQNAFDGDTSEMESPVKDRILGALQEAAGNGASDLHLQPERSNLLIRERLHGNLINRGIIPKELAQQAINYVKITANMDLQLRVPQDSRITIPVHLDGKTQDLRLRVSALPSYHGESVVMRLLKDVSELPTLDQSGFSPTNLQHIKDALSASNGMILVTGPTGSGKTTLMHSSLVHLNDPSLKIVTIEDPIEYEQPYMVQTEIRRNEDPLQDLNFARVLRSQLRQDPDIIFVGEIRDRETAEISMQAAQTGHLLLSTLHTNSALAALTRLMDFGIPAYLLAENLRLVIAQRLVGRPCPDCSVEEPIPTAYRVKDAVSTTMKRGTGLRGEQECPRCSGTGDYGRIAVHEVLVITPELRKVIIEGEGKSVDIELLAQEQGLVSLQHDALLKVASHQANLKSALERTK
ncbi:GspE/PulE family protein [Deinococcus gobiensis]|uniref:General secretory system type II protein, ATPase component n=1 Tax=Deinococcus gobiensis (strain DSM 21396 / JCM 16679 / CGMCC 1.7299 / I-0) TaxID=745776 RepID=H8H1P8_DEIGI|nr:GspE/PulE family protein [Deinococcus gobiensis]AFD27445.1 general secretory system type II protein, ATPase component [Deinococcus gobiensis I-0]